MGKIQQFKNKPEPYAYGQYYYDNDDVENIEPYEESDSLVKPIDKYSDKSLHSLVVSDETRDYIVDNKLRFVRNTSITINNLKVVENSTSDTHIDVRYMGWIFDRNTFDCFDGDSLKSYDDLYDRLHRGGDALEEFCAFMNWDHSDISNNGAPDFSYLFGQNILENLGSELPLSIFQPDYAHKDTLGDIGLTNYVNAGEDNWRSGVDVTEVPFAPNDDVTNPIERLTSIISETTFTDDNYIQIVFWLKSNKSGRSRDRRYYVFKFRPDELLNISDSLISTPGVDANTPLVFGDGDFQTVRGHESKSDTDKPAWNMTNFSVTFNIGEGVPASDYVSKDQNIVNAVEPFIVLNKESFDEDFTQANLFKEPFTSATATGASIWRKNFTPFSIATIKNNSTQNLQGFKNNELERQLCSSPTTVQLRVNISEFDNQDMIVIENAFPTVIPPHYKVCIVDWDDVDDKFETVEDVFDKKPVNLDEVITFQDNNTFIFKEHTESFTNNYTTPGIKKIKILIFNYVEYNNDSWNNDYRNSQLPPFNKIEPIRYKLLTSRIFLDIPLSEFEDFGELGGSAYKTIPWPYTNPVVGGISQNSKYIKSITDTLGGGKIGNQDIIDERFLLEAKDNDELGENIEQMDLEQCRYFNTGLYDMNTLLNIPITTFNQDAEIELFTNLFKESNYGNGNSWYLYVNAAGGATPPRNEMLEYPSTEPPGAVKLNIDTTGTNISNIQIYSNPSVTQVKQGDFYTITFEAKASRAREAYTTVLGAYDPYPRLGLEEYFDISTEYTEFSFTFQATATDEMASARIFLGGFEDEEYDDSSVNIKNFSMSVAGEIEKEKYTALYTSGSYWDGQRNKFSEETSVGQIFITENQDLDLKQSCKLELNTGELVDKSIYDSSGNASKGLLIGDYKIKKTRKGERMRRDSFIKVAKKVGNKDGAL
jgi:hypothetical protein